MKPHIKPINNHITKRLVDKLFEIYLHEPPREVFLSLAIFIYEQIRFNQKTKEGRKKAIRAIFNIIEEFDKTNQ